MNLYACGIFDGIAGMIAGVCIYPRIINLRVLTHLKGIPTLSIRLAVNLRVNKPHLHPHLSSVPDPYPSDMTPLHVSKQCQGQIGTLLFRGKWEKSSLY